MKDTTSTGNAQYRRWYAIAQARGDGRWDARPIVPHRHAYATEPDGLGDQLTMQELVDAIAAALDMEDAPGFLDGSEARTEGPGLRYATEDDALADDDVNAGENPVDDNELQHKAAGNAAAALPGRMFDSIDEMLDTYRSVVIINEEHDDVTGITDDIEGLGVRGALHRIYPNR